MKRVLLPLAVLAIAGSAWADRVLPPEFMDESRATGMSQPINFDFLPDGRVLLVERATARIRLARVVGGVADTVGTAPEVRVGGSDQGLLGIAADDRWPAKPYVYVLFTSTLSYNLKLVRYALTGDLDGTGDGRLALDVASRRDLLVDLPNDGFDHHGGTVMFGPDKKLYVSLGDDRVECSAQDKHQLRGKILRLSVVNVPDGPGMAVSPATLDPGDNPFSADQDARAGLVWQYGLRNPWSYDFDPLSKVFAVADVGEASWEEIDVTQFAGRNFGWPFFEGNAPYDLDCENPDFSTLTSPSFVYPHTGSNSVMLGGICWHPPFLTSGFPMEYWGQVFYYDFYDGRIERLQCDPEGVCVPASPVPGQPDATVWATGFQGAPRMRFGPDGMLWYLLAGELRRISHPGVIGVPDARPGEGALALRAYPLPSRGPLMFESSDPAGGRIGIYDLAGRCVRTLALPAAGAGVARVSWDRNDDAGRAVTGGVFFARLKTATQQATRRLVLL